MPISLEDIRNIEKKWQKKWIEAKIFEPKIDPNKPKFFITVPYPYTSGPLHIGHGRTYTIGDIIARYKRLRGFNVLFPMAFHITGTPIAAISDRISNKDEKAISMYNAYISLYEKNNNRVKEILESFKDPINVATFFANKISSDFIALGYSIDWRRKFHTGETIYNKFIEWQYRVLENKGLLKKGSHYVTYCLLHKQPEGEDDIQDADINPVEIVEFIAIKFEFEDGFILASTLRPETIFGATNLWVNPNAKYVKIKFRNEILYISKEALVKFKHQYEKIEVISELSGSYFIGKKVIDPLGNELIILPASFVDPDTATGFVYSEPSDAPYDYVALEELKRNPKILSRYGLPADTIKKINPIKIIEVPDIDGHHAEIIVKRMGITNQNDPRLEEATRRVYKEQYYKGVMNERSGQFAGMSVKDAKDKVKDWLISNDKALVFYETSRKAFCRAGGKIIIARINDQWFIDYSQEWWKEKTKEWLKQMIILPEKYRKLFFDTVDWLHERPCARKRGLGTKLPFDPNWVIESLSDSTIYMAFYTIVHFIRKYNIKAEQLIPEVFDYVFLNKGNVKDVSERANISIEILREMKREFEYWYPLDQRHTGIPHISNHLTFFVMHHVAIFDQKHWPKAITLNELVIREGRKMAKSKGNVILLRHIVEEYSSDLFRLYVASAADLDNILDWRGKDVQIVQSRLLRFVTIVFEALKINTNKDFGNKTIDRWFLSVFYKKLNKAGELMDNLKFREFVISIFFETLKDLSYYERRTNHERMLMAVRKILPDWIIVLSPIIPHIAEEIWERLGNKSFISVQEWPKVQAEKIDDEAVFLENIVLKTPNWIKEILRALKKEKPNRCWIIVARDLKRRLFTILKQEISKHGYNFSSIIRDLMKIDEFKSNKSLVVKIVRDIIKKREVLPEEIPSSDQEYQVLNDANEYIKREIGCEVIVLHEEEAIKRNIPRANQALPGKPGLFLEF